MDSVLPTTYVLSAKLAPFNEDDYMISDHYVENKKQRVVFFHCISRIIPYFLILLLFVQPGKTPAFAEKSIAGYLDTFISENPKNYTGPVNSIAEFHVTATGIDLSYQWEISTDNGVTWKATDADGNKTDTLSFQALKKRNGYMVRCVVSGVGGTETSDTAKIDFYTNVPTPISESNINDLFVTPEMFGAVGDDKTDDTIALQNALDSGCPVILPPKTYLTTSTLTISGMTCILDMGSTIDYKDTACAVPFTAINNNCDVSLGTIKAENGSGIEFYCDTGYNYCQYINLSFNVIIASKYCIYFNRNGDAEPKESGWLNEIRISDGRFQKGEYGIYADAKGFNSINNIKFYNVAFERVKIGAYMANGCRAWSFINTRISEITKDGYTAFKTVGSMVGLNIIMTDRFNAARSSFSSETQGTVIAPIQGKNYRKETIISGNIGEIIDGYFYVNNQSLQSLQHFVPLPFTDDLNTVLSPGCYSCEDNTTARKLRNSPTDYAFTMIVYYGNGTPDYRIQEIRLNNSNLVYSRTYSVRDKTFSEWQRLLNQDDLISLQNEIDKLREAVKELSK